MALKIQLNGQKVKITNPEKPMITFVNGQKYSVPRGITFVNGQKKVLWGNTGVEIDIINIQNINATNAQYPIFIGQKYAYVSSILDGNVYKINISNVSAPVLEDSFQWGFVATYSYMESNSSEQVYYIEYNGASTSNFIWNKLVVNVSTEEMTLPDSKAFTRPTSGQFKLFGAKISAGYFGCSPLLVAGQVNTKRWYVDATFKYANSDTSSGKLPLAKFDENTIIGGTYTDGSTISFYTPEGMETNIPNIGFVPRGVMTDGTNIAAAGSETTKTAETFGGFALYQNDRTLIKNFLGSSGNNRRMNLLGKIGEYYYVIDAPQLDSRGNILSSDSNSYLRVFNGTTGDLYETLNLPEIQIGLITSAAAYSKLETCPQISQNGYLCGVYVNNLIVRIKGY